MTGQDFWRGLYLHKEINKNNSPQALKEQYQAEYNDLQRELRMESEIKEIAKQLRIQTSTNPRMAS
jgi:hypothetical protein